jgi:hypothetical protein
MFVLGMTVNILSAGCIISAPRCLSVSGRLPPCTVRAGTILSAHGFARVCQLPEARCSPSCFSDLVLLWAFCVCARPRSSALLGQGASAMLGDPGTLRRAGYSGCRGAL